MENKFVVTDKEGNKMDVVYVEGNPSENSEGTVMDGIRAYCFCDGKLVLVHAPKSGHDHWVPPGGGIEKGETYEEAMFREIKEETNMKVIKYRMMGYCDFYKNGKILRQANPVCIVEPYGDFISDPDGDISEIKLIDPKDYKQYFDWGENGDLRMKRALELKAEMEIE